MKNITDKIEHLRVELVECSHDYQGINPALSTALMLKERISKIELEIRDLEEKRRSTIAYKADYAGNTIRDTSLLAPEPV